MTSASFAGTPFEERLAFLIKLASEDGTIRALAPNPSREPGMTFQEEVPFGLLLMALQEGVIVRREGPEYRVNRLRFFFRSSFDRLRRNVEALLSGLTVGGYTDVLARRVSLQRLVVRQFNWVEGIMQAEMVERGVVVFAENRGEGATTELDGQLQAVARGTAEGDVVLVCQLANDGAPILASGESLRMCLDLLPASSEAQ